VARERILETFQIDLQRETLELLVGGRDVFESNQKGRGSLSIRSDILRHREAEMSIISLLVSLMLDQVRFLETLGISAEIIGDKPIANIPENV